MVRIYALSSERVSILSNAKRYTKHSGCNPFNLSLHVLSFLLASLDSLLRDMTHWLPANTHSSGYDNHFDPSFRRSTPRKGIKESANASITQKLYITCMKLYTRKLAHLLT